MNAINKDYELKTLPGDDLRQIMWRYADRFDMQMLIQSTRSVARGPVAHAVAEGARNSHEWNEVKQGLIKHFDDAGISSIFVDAEHGGVLAGPKNLAIALVSYELAWVDGGSATCSLATVLALEPIGERGTAEQKAHYIGGCLPPQPGEDRKIFRGAFALTEPLPYVGVDAAGLSGKMRIAEWEEGKEPMLEIEKRGRFITNMAFANFVTAAVDTDDDRIKTSTMVILEEDDEGLYDRGVPAKKLVHQLSSTRDPIFKLKIPASRIIGGYKIVDGCIVPNYNHGDIIEAVFRRTRVTVGIMSSAKLVSAIEPVIRYHRQRFRGGDASTEGTPRFENGIQQKEDANQRLAEVWSTGEAGCSLGFETARLFDDIDIMERDLEKVLEELGAAGGRAKLKAFRKVQKEAVEYINMSYQPESERDAARFEELGNNTLVKFTAKDSLANVLCPATKLWCTGWGATMMREAISLMGGYGITEDCPGFLLQKWTDIQLEATYEGPEVVQRRQLTLTMTSPLFITHMENWVRLLNELEVKTPDIGAKTLAAGMELWMWTIKYAQSNKDENGNKLYMNNRQGSTFGLTDALSFLLASKYQMEDILELAEKGPANPIIAEGLPGYLGFFSDLACMQAARAAGEASRICAEVVFGFNKTATEKAAEFHALRAKVDESMAGARLAKDRAGVAISKVMIPEALDYPM